MVATPRLAGGLGYSQVRSLDKGSGEPLSDTMADQWMANFEYFFANGLTLGTDLRFAEMQKHVPAGVDPTPGYFLQDFHASYEWRRLAANLRVNNAYDRDYRSHTSAIKGTGRDVRLSLAYTF